MVRSSSQIVLLLLWFLCGAIFCLSLSRGNSHMLCNRKDRDVLLQFKKGVVDPSGLLSSWSNREDCCEWIGVHCHNKTGRVTKLDLSFYIISQQNYRLQGLTGEINLCVLQLDFLNHLDLSSNDFTIIQDSTNDRQRYYNSSFSTPHLHNANISSLHYLDLSSNPYLKIDNWRWLSLIPSLKYLNLSFIDLQGETDCLHSISTLLPSLLELRLKWCQLNSVRLSSKYANFTSLTVFDLFCNNFNSKVIEWVSNFGDSLSYLDLGCNLIDAITDTLLNLQNLKYLSLSWNKLKGTIPNWLAQFKNLQELDLSENSFHGSIPLVLGNLSSLTQLIVGGNSLGGVLTESNFANLTNLKVLDISLSAFQFNVNSDWIPPFQLEEIRLKSCILGPKFPIWLYTQRFLQILDISTTRISVFDHNQFWSFVSNITSILDLSNNSITGDISNLVLSTDSIDLTSNKFHGELPRITPDVGDFFASDNSFSGSISPLLCGTGKAIDNGLWFLDLSNNHLFGELPDCWMNWKGLITINLASNNLTGSIPPSMGKLSNLAGLYLYDNNLSGGIPLSLQQCNQLKFLNVAGNKFSGSISSGMPQSLVALNLRGNEFRGNIPPQICQLSCLIILDLADNSLSGPIPKCLHNLTSMKSGSTFKISGFFIPKIDNIYPYTFKFHPKGLELEYKFDLLNLWRYIDLSKNNLTGSIQPELMLLVGLISLNLSQNHLRGTIPQEIGQMKNLESLDLSMNQLFGEIPQVMASLSFLEYLNLSFNNFIGRIPTGTQLQSFDPSSYVGNPELCGAPLKNCAQEKKSVDIVNAKDQNEFLSCLYIGMGVGFATGFWGVCIALFFKRAWRHAYFKFLDEIKEQVYMKVHLIINSIR
ncbi:hypothetical protein L6164_013561 [Bauhinia variegata]|uniref:Uncharacterized protein n=1 Tax=Bauhinia variegata TaxID=167791 RepID=A0ACB9NFB2_BAUVA|nr:hypothetical protein L6164_013561 [Bauhinia variegata]